MASVSELLSNVRDLAYVGTSTRDWDDTKLLRRFNARVQDYLIPLITSHARKGRFETFTDRAIVANVASYRIPSAAQGGRLRALQLVDAATGNPYAPLKEFTLEEQIGFTMAGARATGMPVGYMFLGNSVVLYPTPNG